MSIKYDEVENYILKIKKIIVKKIEKKRWNEALSLISAAVDILYDTNLYYVDWDLENDIAAIAKELIEPGFLKKNLNEDILVFYDGFGLNTRGLAQIYLKALCKIKRVVYITYVEAEKRIPDIQAIVKNNNGKIIYLEKTSLVKRIYALDQMIKTYKPQNFFFYAAPNDVVATTIMNAYQGIIKNFQINLTDHAFWLGAKPIDCCIEFRSYGACISKRYRNIPQDKIFEIPFYPIINYDEKFKGFPFDVKKNQKVVFSGGFLYKTLGGENKYYKIVDYMLEKHQDVIFWYAGRGDQTEIDKIIKKYPNRAYLTAERSDLFQVLKHSYLYLSTYPLCGGLMFQYAASASKVPITLRQGSVTDGFLINQDHLKIQFDDMDLFLNELDYLLDHPEYTQERGELMRKSVISETAFQKAVSQLLENKNTGYEITYKEVDTEEFRQNYLDTLTSTNICLTMARIDNGVVCEVYPWMFLKGCVIRVKNRIEKKFNLIK